MEPGIARQAVSYDPEALRFRDIRESDSTVDFQTREEALASFLRDRALLSERAGTARTRVLEHVNGEHCPVWGFFSLAMTGLGQDQFSAGSAEREGSVRVPGVLPCQLARDSRTPKGVGEILMVEIGRCVAEAAARSGCRGIMLDAINDGLVSHYARHGFEKIGKSSQRKMLVRLDEFIPDYVW